MEAAAGGRNRQQHLLSGVGSPVSIQSLPRFGRVDRHKQFRLEKTRLLKYCCIRNHATEFLRLLLLPLRFLPDPTTLPHISQQLIGPLHSLYSFSDENGPGGVSAGTVLSFLSPRFSGVGDPVYSALSVWTGSTLLACRAGTYEARVATPKRARAARKSTIGSLELT